MPRRYSDIKRAYQLKNALDGFVNHIQTSATRPRRINTRGALNLNKIVYVAPFTAHVDVDEVCAARTNDESWQAISPSILGGSSAADVVDALGTKTLVSLPSFRAARIVFFTNATRSVTVETSEVTGLQYLKYAGNRYSCPFGANTDAIDQMEAFAEVKAHLLTTFANNDVKRVSLSREFVGLE